LTWEYGDMGIWGNMGTDGTFTHFAAEKLGSVPSVPAFPRVSLSPRFPAAKFRCGALIAVGSIIVRRER
jgi:hypothetical protein